MIRDRAPLRVVRPDETPRPPTTPKELLAAIVPELLAAEAVVARLRQLMLEQGRRLATIEGVAFIREERLRNDFAPPKSAPGRPL